MGLLTKVAGMISSGLAAGSLLADTAGIASFSLLSDALQAGGTATRTIFQHVDTTLERTEEVLEVAGVLGDRLAAELSTRLLGEAMAAVRAAGLAETETAIRAERIIETVKAAIEKGDFKRLETGLGDILEAGLFGVTALQPNLVLVLFLLQSAIVTASQSLVDRGLLPQEEGLNKARTLCARVWRMYGRVYHGQEWIGLHNIPKEGALIIYYHGVLPVDYYGLIAELWLSQGRQVASVVDRSLMQIPAMASLRAAFRLFPGTVDECADLLRAGNLLGIAPGGAYESLFGDNSYPVLWQSRLGFARVALAAGRPIVPVFTENIRENTRSLAGRMTLGRRVWERLYRATKLPVVPMYGLFPVKLRTHIGPPIHPQPGQTAEQLASQTVQALEQMIATHQELPGSLATALVARLPDSTGRLSRSSSWSNLAGAAPEE